MSESEFENQGRAEAPARKARVLLVDADADARDDARRILADLPIDVGFAATTGEARVTLHRDEFDVLLIDTSDTTGDAFELAAEQCAHEAPLQVLMVSRRPSVSTMVRSMRSGAADLLRKPYDPEELVSRLDAAVERAETARHKARRVERLRRICKRLNEAREEVAREVDVLCNDLVNAYEDLAVQVSNASVASEFTGVIRRELDVEALLRSALEYLLTKTGPTNAAIYLPTGFDDYSLGAYVNYSLPKDTADVLLDHLADVLPARFESEDAITRVESRAEIRRRIGESVDWLADSNLLIFPCVHEGECLAVVTLFRDALRPFDPELLPLLDVIRALFGEQLARVIRVHNRHKSDEIWTGFDVDPGDREDEAEGYGFDADLDDFDNLAA